LGGRCGGKRRRKWLLDVGFDTLQNKPGSPQRGRGKLGGKKIIRITRGEQEGKKGSEGEETKRQTQKYLDG